MPPPTRLAAHLPNLPTELVEQIAQFLSEGTDITSLRLTCRDVYAKTSATFEEFFFGTVEVDLSATDIERLQVLAKKGDLCKRMHTFCIRPTHRTPWTRSDDISNTNPWELRPKLGLGNHWKRTIEGSLHEDNPTISTLCDLFKDRFTQCTSFRVYRGGTDMHEEKYTSTSVNSADATTILLRIIALTGLPIRSFELHISSGTIGEIQPPRISSSMWAFGWFSSTWALSLTSLKLAYTLSSPEVTAFTSHLIMSAKSLHHLSFYSHSNDATALCKALADGNGLPPIQRLDLMNCVFSLDALLRVLLLIRNTLTAVVFHGVRLVGGDWPTLFEALRDGCHTLRKITLCFVLEALDTEQNNVKRRTFGYLRDCSTLRGLIDGKFELLERTKRRRRRVVGIQYAGKDMDTALRILTRHSHSIAYNYTGGPEVPDGETTRATPMLEEFSIYDYYPEY